LADFQSHLKEFDAEQMRLMAGSVDPLDKTKELAEKLGVTFPVAYGMDAEDISGKTGAFYEAQKKIIQPTGLLVRPDKTVEVGVFSTGPVGRFVAQDVLKLVRFYKSRAKN